jgi:hypothetical protein
MDAQAWRVSFVMDSVKMAAIEQLIQTTPFEILKNYYKAESGALKSDKSYSVTWIQVEKNNKVFSIGIEYRAKAAEIDQFNTALIDLFKPK